MENIDKVFYINLDHRKDRRQQFTDEINKIFMGTVLEERIERFPAIKHSIGLVGCGMSHLKIVKDAKEKGYKYIIIFEDDFQFLISQEQFIQNINNLFNYKNDNPTWDFKVVMLGYNTLNQTPFNDFLNITTEAQTASGYIVNSTHYDELIHCWEEGLNNFITTGMHWLYACDQCWKKIQNEKWYIFKQRIGLQRPSYSDCSNTFVNYNC